MRRLAGSQPSAPPSVVAIFGPTASGKTAVAEAVADRLGGEVLSADSMQAYRGLPILTAQPDRPTTARRDLAAGPRGLRRRLRPLAHAAIDELRRRRPDPRRRPAAPASTSAPRWQSSSCLLPRARSSGRGGSSVYDRLGPERAYGVLAQRDPGAAARLHANDRRRVVRALELTELGSSLRPDADRLWTSETRLPTSSSGSMSPRRPDGADRAARPRRCSPPASSTRRGRARRTDLVDRRPVRSACARSRSLRTTRRSRHSSSARAATPPTSGSGCDASPALLASTPIVPWTTSPMKLSKWQALGNDYLLVEQAELTEPLTPDRVRQLCDYHYGVGSDGLLEVAASDGHAAEVRIWNPDGSTAELSGNGVRIVAAWLARESGAERVTISVGPAPGRGRDRSRTASDRRSTSDEVEVGETETLDLGDEQRRIHARLGRQSARCRPARARARRAAATRSAHRTTLAFPGANERAARPCRRVARPDRRRVGARGGGDAVVGNELGLGRRRRNCERLVREPGHRPSARR